MEATLIIVLNFLLTGAIVFKGVDSELGLIKIVLHNGRETFYFSLEWSKLVAEFPIASSRKGSRLERTEPKLNYKLDVKLGSSLFRAQAYIGKLARAQLVDSPVHAD
uniref:rRNA N-glycosidase n=1 Tax=Oryza glaberrima TaxID=4538 RepID=I1R684_ORYGL